MIGLAVVVRFQLHLQRHDKRIQVQHGHIYVAVKKRQVKLPKVSMFDKVYTHTRIDKNLKSCYNYFVGFQIQKYL